MIFYRIGCYVLILTGLLKLIGQFQEPTPANERERQLWELMTTYQVDVGNGATVTIMGIQKGFSLCFSLMFLWAGVLGLFLVKQFAGNPGGLRKIAIINSAALVIGTGISVVYFFFIPTACFALALVFFILAVFRIK